MNVNLMDDATYRWWQVIGGPLLGVVLTAIVTALIAGGLTLLATRWEADRAEKRARSQWEAQTLMESLRATQADLNATLYAIVNRLHPVGAEPVHPPPDTFAAPLVGDAAAIAKMIRLWTELGSRPIHSGVTKADMESVSDAVDTLRVAVERQADRIRKGVDLPKVDPGDVQRIVDEAKDRLGPLVHKQ